MSISHLYVADCHMTWNGINLNPGDLFGHDDWSGCVYSHVPAAGNFVIFERLDGGNCCSLISNLPSNITHWETDDGRIYFEEAEERSESPYVVIAPASCWDGDLVESILEDCGPNDEVAMYIEGDTATFFINPVYSSPDTDEYGKLIETWYM